MWYVYILRCSDGSLYTGITTDIDKRLTTHNSKKGSRSLRGKLPAQVVYSERKRSRSTASKREYAIKQLTRIQKLNLIEESSSKP